MRKVWFCLNILMGIGFTLVAFAGPREEAFAYEEQHNNIMDIYKAGVFDTDLPEHYQAKNESVFRLPYFIIPLQSKFLREVAIDGIPSELAPHHVVERNGIKFFKYLIHPAATEYHRKIFRDQFEFVKAENSEFLARPTASERTLVMIEPSNYTYMPKLNLPIKINHRDRTMYPTEIKRGIWLTAVMNEIVSKNSFLKKNFFIFEEPYGIYPKVDGEALGGAVFRKYPKNFYENDMKVIPLFSLLAVSEKTGKPMFFEFIPPGVEPWQWFEASVLNPMIRIIDELTYKNGISLELHSQNLLVQIDTKNNSFTGRFGYRDLASTHLDFLTLAALKKPIPRSELIGDFQRELGGLYSKKSELEWLEYFFKKQVSDLFFIQMATHGLISREKREEYKARSWNKVVDNHKKNYKGSGTFSDAFVEVLSLKPTMRNRCELLFLSH